jgi:hypothetical protein
LEAEKRKVEMQALEVTELRDKVSILTEKYQAVPISIL